MITVDDIKNREVYTVKETAHLLKKDPMTIFRYLKYGKLEGVRVGLIWLISARAIADFLNKGNNFKKIE